MKKTRTQAPATLTLKSPCFACGYENGLLLKQYGNRYAVKCGKCGTYQYSVNLSKTGEVSDA